MPNRITITEPAANVVQITENNNVVQITENHLSLTVSAGSGGSGSSFELGADLVVTNTIGDAIAGTTTYTAGTNLETIIQDILAPFLEPSIFSIKAGSSNSPDTPIGEDYVMQTGLDNRVIQGWFYNIPNIQNLDNNTNISVEYNYNLGTSIINNSVNWDNVTLNSAGEYNAGAFYLTPSGSALNNNGAYYTVTHSFGYLLDGTGNVVTLTKQTKIIYRHPVYVYANTSATFTDVASIISNGTQVRTTVEADPNSATQTISFACNSHTADATKYTYLIIPSIFTATEIAATTSGLGVADYTDSFVFYDNGGNGFNQTAGTATRNYNVYRSIQTGAFDDDIDLTITLTT